MNFALENKKNFAMVYTFSCFSLLSQNFVEVTNPKQCLVKKMSSYKEVTVPCCSMGSSALLPWRRTLCCLR